MVTLWVNSGWVLGALGGKELTWPLLIVDVNPDGETIYFSLGSLLRTFAYGH